jgi:hypothetical protein
MNQQRVHAAWLESLWLAEPNTARGVTTGTAQARNDRYGQGSQCERDENASPTSSSVHLAQRRLNTRTRLSTGGRNSSFVAGLCSETAVPGADARPAPVVGLLAPTIR